METKALKKQMGAAIAMVLVAAVALGSATFAWFVTNNEVKATTSTISAQSNAAFMTIANGATGAQDVDTTEVTTEVQTKALYPATYGEETGSTAGTFMSGFGTSLTDGTLHTTLAAVKDPNGTETAGTNAAAVAGEYALLQQYNISSKGQNLSDLKVKEVTGTTNESGLKTALRILVTNADGSAWEVWGLSSDGSAYELKLSSAANSGAATSAVLGAVTAGEDTAVNVYLYYEGKDTNVTTSNLQDKKLTATNAVTVTFTATADNK